MKSIETKLEMLYADIDAVAHPGTLRFLENSFYTV